MEIRLSWHGRHVTIVTIDNQSRLNAITRQMLAELSCLWDELERDGNFRCIILTGTGRAGAFRRTEEAPLDWDLLVDETSIVDVPLMRALLNPLPEEAAPLLVGDVDQLPSVGPREAERGGVGRSYGSG
jgi:ATP-dependent exoDNAse (exonuclease V) alpha subunit